MFTFEDLDVEIERACYQRMIDNNNLFLHKRLHRLYRMWITAELRKRYDVCSWKHIHPVDYEDAVRYIQKWPNKYKNNLEE